MSILSLEKITKSYTGRLLFDEASFFLEEGEKVGVIGINGTGKSTLLKIIAGIEEPDEGKRTCATNMVIRYLPQHPQYDAEDTVIEAVMKDAHHTIEESDAKSMLTKLGVSDFEAKTGTLSGGQRKRLALVAALLTPSDVLVLDEPTNHLDSAMSTWLEEKLRNYKGSLVMVTHDRYFLDLVCNRIAEVDKGSIYSYDENYVGFLARKSERENIAQAAERKRQSILRKEIEWMQRGARARSTKQKAHIQRYENLVSQTAPETDGRVEISSAYSRLGRTTIEINNISKAYGDKVLIKDYSYTYVKDDRIGYVGPNGSGKTTLMKMLVGDLEPDSGNIVVGQTVKIGYYTQEISNDPSMGIAYMNPKDKVIDYIRNVAEFVTTAEGKISASVMLDRFLFTDEMKYSLIEKLSGGEKRRLNLIRVLMESPNVLILDEPTNDLDIATLQILEDYLDSFAGIVITVSHDRYFLDRVVRRIIAFDGNGVLTQHEGGYTDYENRVGINTEFETAASGNNSAKESTNSNKTRSHEQKLKFSYNEQKEYDSINDVIEQLENRITELDEEITKNATNAHKLNELMAEKESVEEELEQKMDRWMYLSELAEKIEAQNK